MRRKLSENHLILSIDKIHLSSRDSSLTISRDKNWSGREEALNSHGYLHLNLRMNTGDWSDPSPNCGGHK